MTPILLVIAGMMMGAAGCYVAVPAYLQHKDHKNNPARFPVELTELSVSRRDALRETNLLKQEILFGEPEAIRYHSTRLYVETQRLSNLIK